MGWADGQPSQVVQGDLKTDIASFNWPKGSDTNQGLIGASGFSEFGFGTRVWGNVPTVFDVYYDDIAIDSKRIGPRK